MAHLQTLAVQANNPDQDFLRLNINLCSAVSSVETQFIKGKILEDEYYDQLVKLYSWFEERADTLGQDIGVQNVSWIDAFSPARKNH